jgi:hypothetical protein
LVYFPPFWYIFTQFGVINQEKSGNPAHLIVRPLNVFGGSQVPLKVVDVAAVKFCSNSFCSTGWWSCFSSEKLMSKYVLFHAWSLNKCFILVRVWTHYLFRNVCFVCTRVL